MIPFKEIQAARGGCPMCTFGIALHSERFGTHKCNSCNGSGNGTIKHWQKIEVPDGYEFVKRKNYTDFLSSTSATEKPMSDYVVFLNCNGIDVIEIALPHKVGDTITETCDACGGLGGWYKEEGLGNGTDCTTCQGNSEATLTCQKIEHQMQDGEHGFYTEWREQTNDRE